MINFTLTKKRKNYPLLILFRKAFHFNCKMFASNIINKSSCNSKTPMVLNQSGIHNVHIQMLPFLWGDPCCSSFIVFCVVLLCVFRFWVPCCDVRYNFHIKTMFGSSLPPVVCSKAHVLFVFVYIYWCPTQVVLCFCFSSSCVPYPMLPVSLDCPFFISPSVFSNIYLCGIHNIHIQMLRWPTYLCGIHSIHNQKLCRPIYLFGNS